MTAACPPARHSSRDWCVGRSCTPRLPPPLSAHGWLHACTLQMTGIYTMQTPIRHESVILPASMLGWGEAALRGFRRLSLRPDGFTSRMTGVHRMQTPIKSACLRRAFDTRQSSSRQLCLGKKTMPFVLLVCLAQVPAHGHLVGHLSPYQGRKMHQLYERCSHLQ